MRRMGGRQNTDLLTGSLLRAPVAAPELLVLLPDGLAPPRLVVLPRPQRLGHLCAAHANDFNLAKKKEFFRI